jgi:hypothetical protein
MLIEIREEESKLLLEIVGEYPPKKVEYLDLYDKIEEQINGGFRK